MLKCEFSGCKVPKCLKMDSSLLVNHINILGNFKLNVKIYLKNQEFVKNVKEKKNKYVS